MAPTAAREAAQHKEWLLGEGPRFEDIVPKRGGWKSRPAVDFSGPEFK
jgi:hypothetical protein